MNLHRRNATEEECRCKCEKYEGDASLIWTSIVEGDYLTNKYNISFGLSESKYLLTTERVIISGFFVFILGM